MYFHFPQMVSYAGQLYIRMLFPSTTVWGLSSSRWGNDFIWIYLYLLVQFICTSLNIRFFSWVRSFQVIKKKEHSVRYELDQKNTYLKNLPNLDSYQLKNRGATFFFWKPNKKPKHEECQLTQKNNDAITETLHVIFIIAI